VSVITVRVPREIKRRLERRGVNVSKTVRTLLEGYVAGLELQDLGARLDALKERLGGRIEGELVAKLVREDRETR